MIPIHYLRFSLLISVLFVSFFILYSQTPINTTSSVQMLEEAIAKSDSGWFKKSNILIEEILPVLKHKKNETYFKALNTLSFNFILDFEFDAASENLKITKKAISEHVDTSKSLEFANYNYLMGVYYNYTGRFNLGKTHFESALKQQLEILQTEEHPVIIRTYQHLGMNANFRVEFNDAVTTLKKGISLSEKINDRALLGELYSDLGYCYGDMQEAQKEMDAYKKALGILKKVWNGKHPYIGVCYHNIGYFYGKKGHYHKQKFYYTRAKNMYSIFFHAEHGRIGEVINNLGVHYFYIGNPKQALKYLKQGLEITKKTGLNISIASNYHNIATIYGLLNDSDSEILYEFEALKYIDRSDRKFPSLKSTIYSSIGVAYSSEDNYEEAIKYTMKAKNVLNGEKDVLFEALALVNYNLGLYYTYTNRKTEGMKLINDALNMLLERTSVRPHYLSIMYINFGQLYYEKKEYDIAIDYFKKSWNILESAPEKDLNSISRSLEYIGRAYNEQKRYEDALFHIQYAINQWTSMNIDEIDWKTNPSLDLIPRKIRTIALFAAKAQVIHNLAKLDNSAEFLLQSKNSFDITLALIEDLRLQYILDMPKYGFVKRYTHIYQEAAQVNFELWQEFKEEKYKTRSFELVEKGRSFDLLESFNTNEAVRFSGIEDSLLVKEGELRAEIIYIKNLVIKEKEEIQRKQLELDLRAQEVKYQSLKKEMEKDNPLYFQMRYNTKTSSVDEIQKMLNEDNCIVEYLISDSTLLTYLITKQRFDIIPIPIDSTFQAMIQNLNISIRTSIDGTNQTSKIVQNHNKSYIKNANELYQKLIKPIANQLDLPQNIIIIPHKSIFHVPFDILLKDVPKNKNDFNSYPFLIKDHEFTYAYSSTLLKHIIERKIPQNINNKVLAFAPSVSGERSVLGREPKIGMLHGKQEIESINTIIGCKLLFGEEATETKFKELAKEHRIIHISSHAQAIDTLPRFSGILFTDNPTDSLDDGYLTAGEIYNFKMNAEMIVLSACETGTGKIEEGEGLVGLAHACTYAGAKSIVASQWKVDELSSLNIMKTFYKSLKQGEAKPQALRTAKLQYLESADGAMAHPVFWAAFINMGDYNPIVKHGYSIYWTIASIVLVIGLVFWWYRKRKKTLIG